MVVANMNGVAVFPNTLICAMNDIRPLDFDTMIYFNIFRIFSWLLAAWGCRKMWPLPVLSRGPLHSIYRGEKAPVKPIKNTVIYRGPMSLHL